MIELSTQWTVAPTDNITTFTLLMLNPAGTPTDKIGKVTVSDLFGAMQLSANVRAILAAADHAAVRTLLSLGSAAQAATSDFAAASHTHPQSDVTNLVADLAGKAAASHAHAAADVTSGQFAMARLASGAPNGAKFIRDDGILASPTASVAATTVEKNLGATPTWRGKFTITDAAITATSKVLVWQAPGPYTGKGTRADEAEAQPVQVVYVEPAAGSCAVAWQTPPMIVMRPVIPGGSRSVVAPLVGESHPVLSAQRIGKVSGNVKFSYLVAS